jgi:hypothetical protein
MGEAETQARTVVEIVGSGLLFGLVSSCDANPRTRFRSSLLGYFRKPSQHVTNPRK